jgi:hypothetical protein
MLEKLLAPLCRLNAPRRDSKKSPFLAFLDYAYMPYALGDAITWVENAQVRARDAGADAIDIVVLTSRERPAPEWQPHITSYNYVGNLQGIIPALLSSPMTRNVHLLENRQTFYAMVMDLHDHCTPMWPHAHALIEERLDFISHMRIVEHYRRTGSIPLLEPPRGYAQQAAAFVSTFCRDRFRVVVNIRQSHLRAARAQPERDSQFDIWADFIAHTARKYPDVVFIVAGQYSDVDRRFGRLPETLVPRSVGFGLGVELALLQGADLFMGTSSGFAQAALFGHPSYVVTNTEPRAAAYCGVAAGARHHPFGRRDQIVTWSPETVDSLTADFEAVVAAKADMGSRTPARHA